LLLTALVFDSVLGQNRHLPLTWHVAIKDAGTSAQPATSDGQVQITI